MEKRVKVTAILLGLVFVAGIIIWSCIYFIIYYPLMNRNWTEANCTVTEVRNFTITYVSIIDYSVYTAIVERGDTVIGEGYGCSTSSNEGSIGVEISAGVYPYEYSSCSDFYVAPSDSCKEDELLQPCWLCFGYSERYKYQIGSTVKCKYYINGAESDTYTYPQQGEDFIEVLYQEEVYIPMADYIALWVCAFGFTCVLPCVLCFVGLSVPLGWCTAAERQKYRDFYRRFLCCRRKQLPSCIEELGDIFAKAPPSPLIIWLHTVKRRPELFPMKAVLIREIGDYLTPESN